MCHILHTYKKLMDPQRFGLNCQVFSIYVVRTLGKYKCKDSYLKLDFLSSLREMQGTYS